jgi:signal transduction histidine kinase
VISIRRRLTLGLVAGLLGLSLVSAPLVWFSLRRLLLGQLDVALTAKARAVGALLSRDGQGRVELELQYDSMPEFAGGAHAEYFAVFHSSGELIARSRSLGQRALAPRAGAPSPACWNAVLPDGRPGRSVQIIAVPEVDDEGHRDQARRDEDPVMVVVAGDRGVVEETSRVFLLVLLGASTVIGLLTVVLVTRTVRGGLSPLARLADQAAVADVTSLTYRFSTEGMPAELVPICDRLNDLLDRVAVARERERRFTSDVAHELRTPIAELRSLSEVALKWPPDAATATRAFEDAREVARQMETTVTALLALARADAKRKAVRQERLDLREIVLGEWKANAALATAQGLEVELDLVDGAWLLSDPTLLSSMVGNLLANAVFHAPSGGQIRVEVTRRENGLQLAVRNTNDSLEPEDLAHIFEPFWRKDPARSPSTHSGLGLSLVAAYARLVGAQVLAELVGDCFLIRLLLAQIPPTPPAARADTGTT